MQLSREVLEAAAKHSGSTFEKVARSIAKKSSDRDRIIEYCNLSFAQIDKYAKETGYPALLLMASEPVEIEELKYPEFRRSSNSTAELDEIFKTLYLDTLIKRDWYKELLLNIGYSKNPLVKKYSLSDIEPDDDNKIEEIASEVRAILKLDDFKTKGYDKFFDYIRQNIEAEGILVFRSSTLYHHVGQALNPEQFLGFALVDEVAPLIFINRKDVIVRQVFTIVHEFLHILFGEEVIDSDLLVNDRVEDKINIVAANILVPKEKFLTSCLEKEEAGKDRKTALDEIAKSFNVSVSCVYRVAHQQKIITIEEYQNFYKGIINQFKDKPKKPKGKIRIDPNKLKPGVYGKFYNRVMTELHNERIGYKEASRLINVNMFKL